MREIKFRGYFEKTKRWHYGLLWFDGEKTYAIVENRNGDEWNFPVVQESIGQYTGLKDKNGREIYEGDILSTDLSRPYLIVEFRNGAFLYQCHDSGNDYYDIMVPIYVETNQDDYSEIIGNIYENPELLEETK